MDYQEKIYILLGGLLIINLIVFVFSRRLLVQSQIDFGNNGKYNFDHQQAGFFIKAENIIDFDYFLIEGCVISRKKDNIDNLSKKKGS